MKKERKEKQKNDKALKKSKADKEKVGSKFIRTIKKKWLIKGTSTLLLVAILIAIFILINIGFRKLNITAIDVSTSKDNSLTDISKNRVKDIDKDIKISFVGYKDDDPQFKLAKQYNSANKKISVDIVDANKDVEFAKKYNITDASSNPTIVVECGEKNKTLGAYDIYDYISGEYTTEQKLTSAILNVASSDIPKAYFLQGYTSLSFEKGLSKLATFLDEEVLTYESANILTTGKVPDDCDSLIIFTPEKDFDDITTKAIQEYIKKGGNILWLNSAKMDNKVDFKNVNKILAEYGVNPFELGVIYETSQNNTFLGYPTFFQGQLQSTDITKDIESNSGGVVFFTGTKININSDKLDDLKVEETDIIKTSDTAYYTTDLTGKMDTKKDTQGPFTIGAELVKTIKEKDENDENSSAVESKLVIYGNDVFVTDTVLTYTNQSVPIYTIDMLNNADVVLNSVGDLTNKEENITIRRDYSDAQTTFTPTDGQKDIIVKIIFVVPVAIIALGIIVWIVRKNRK